MIQRKISVHSYFIVEFVCFSSFAIMLHDEEYTKAGHLSYHLHKWCKETRKKEENDNFFSHLDMIHKHIRKRLCGYVKGKMIEVKTKREFKFCQWYENRENPPFKLIHMQKSRLFFLRNQKNLFQFRKICFKQLHWFERRSRLKKNISCKNFCTREKCKIFLSVCTFNWTWRLSKHKLRVKYSCRWRCGLQNWRENANNCPFCCHCLLPFVNLLSG